MGGVEGELSVHAGVALIVLLFCSTRGRELNARVRNRECGSNRECGRNWECVRLGIWNWECGRKECGKNWECGRN